MRLTQVLLRKRKMNRKVDSHYILTVNIEMYVFFQPESFVRSWQWNNSWYIAQLRPVYPIGMKVTLLFMVVVMFILFDDPRKPWRGVGSLFTSPRTS